MTSTHQVRRAQPLPNTPTAIFCFSIASSAPASTPQPAAPSLHQNSSSKICRFAASTDHRRPAILLRGSVPSPLASAASLSSIEDLEWVEMIGGAGVRLKGWQQAAVALGSAVGALLDPRRADLIAALGETTGKPAFERVLQRMKNSPEGRAILLERPRVISSKVSHAWDLPDNTFGAAYAKFMGSQNFSPDDRPPVRFMETEELAYVAMRAREVHDFWHTLFGLPTNLIGETALKVIEFEQMMLPMCMMSVVGGTARFSEKQRRLFYQHYFPWAMKAGLRCTDLMCVYYEQHFSEDLEDFRQRLGIIPAPPPPRPHYM
nr:ubiquinone biosynthesis protein COQ4 homolog, mitochondrial [Ipomoea batatas]